MSSGVRFTVGLRRGQPSGVHLHVAALLLRHVGGRWPALALAGAGGHVGPVGGRVRRRARPLVWRLGRWSQVRVLPL